MGIYGTCIALALLILFSFTSINIVHENQDYVKASSIHSDMDMFNQYADYTRNSIRALQESNNLPTSRPAYVKVNGIPSSYGTELIPTKPLTMLQTPGIIRLGLSNILDTTPTGQELLYIWANPSNENVASNIRKNISQLGIAPFYTKTNAGLVSANRNKEILVLPAQVNQVIPLGSVVLIQHPVEK